MERPTLLEQIQAMLVNYNEILKNDINSINNNMNSLKTDMNKSNQAFNDNVKKLQAGSIAIREEVLARIAARSRASSRA